jgi:DNA-binding SARP family transcriptional activator
LVVPTECRDDLLFEEVGRPALVEEDFDAMRQAIDLYQGDYLPDDRYFDWTDGRRRDLFALYRRLVLRGWPLAVAAGQADRAVEWLESLMVADPSEEGTARILMRLYLEVGRRVDALRLYSRLTESLRTDLDVDPEFETTALYERARLPGYRDDI